MADVTIIYVVVSGGGLETAWTEPMLAIEANERVRSSTSYIAVRPLNSEEPTEESRAALAVLRKMERERHNARAEAIREASERRRRE